MIEQLIEVRTEDITEFNTLADHFDIWHSLKVIQLEDSKIHLGMMKGLQIDMLLFVSTCGRREIPLFFPASH